MYEHGDDEDQEWDGEGGEGARGGGGGGGAYDPFGVHGSAYYAPGARRMLGGGDEYDLSAWAWARDVSPHQRGAKKRKRHIQAEQQQQQGYGVHARPATTTTSAPTSAATTAAGDGETVVGGTGSGSVYRAPIHAASAPQLSYVRRADMELEYLRALANARTRATVVRPPVPPASAGARDSTPGQRRGMRPLLLPQKLGLMGSGGPQRETGKVDSVASGRRGRDASGWELDLERGVCGEDGNAER